MVNTPDANLSLPALNEGNIRTIKISSNPSFASKLDTLLNSMQIEVPLGTGSLEPVAKVAREAVVSEVSSLVMDGGLKCSNTKQVDQPRVKTIEKSGRSTTLPRVDKPLAAKKKLHLQFSEGVTQANSTANSSADSTSVEAPDQLLQQSCTAPTFYPHDPCVVLGGEQYSGNVNLVADPGRGEPKAIVARLNNHQNKNSRVHAALSGISSTPVSNDMSQGNSSSRSDKTEESTKYISFTASDRESKDQERSFDAYLPENMAKSSPASSIVAADSPSRDNKQYLEFDRAEIAESGLAAHAAIGLETSAVGSSSFEVQLPHSMHGVLKVKASIADDGTVVANLSSTSSSGGEMLHRELSSLASFLADEKLHVSSLIVHKMAEAPEAAIQQRGEQFGPGHQAFQQSGDGRPKPEPELGHRGGASVAGEIRVDDSNDDVSPIVMHGKDRCGVSIRA